ncbi:uncharacterized protein RCC_09882 [Ramularia collo-cygni]|uniref:ATPase synthesis protein 25 n=1 Tax=Ramularia collo-cygni TaxID=112498 RepID=A0A2D3VED0_9PEZI|nr:uncharacterized protein RCC_09882 [Ramularia collo-cygni]CZT24165.1 uncharacterized protein RCC_09882 [Ramularia collo-cygni]
MALSRTLACSHCRQWLVKSFITTFNIPQVAAPQRRNFSAPPRRWNEARERIQHGESDELALNNVNEEAANLFKDEAKDVAEEMEAEVEESEEAEHIPWYLRTSSPLQSTVPDAIAERQRMPDLPENPPPLLAPLLKQISVELGIDDLTLLDLRGLDPPPALGANLLMLIGTARSEKHLHVSADKLCRWLRSEHYLSPYADGLLGRQELKLKLRRKAKRSKLMGAVGGKGGGDGEDLAEGIRTGWVCVNVGVVEGAEGGVIDSGEQVVEKEGAFVGFGPGKSSGVRIVVQILTEEKREEVDLEKLWTAVLKKSEREKEAIAKQEAIEEEIEEVVEVVEPAKVAAEEVLAEVDSAPEAEGEQHRPARIRGLRGRQQIRAYHTSAKKLQDVDNNNNHEPSQWDAIAQSARTDAEATEDSSHQPTMQTPEDEAEQFYSTFRSFPALGVRRSAGLYTTMFNHIASGAFRTLSSNRRTLRDDGMILGVGADEMEGLPAESEFEDATIEMLKAIRGSAEAKAILGETLCSMESEAPPLSPDGEGAVERAMAVLKAIRAVDVEGAEGHLVMWRERCERVLRKALEG